MLRPTLLHRRGKISNSAATKSVPVTRWTATEINLCIRHMDTIEVQLRLTVMRAVRPCPTGPLVSIPKASERLAIALPDQTFILGRKIPKLLARLGRLGSKILCPPQPLRTTASRAPDLFRSPMLEGVTSRLSSVRYLEPRLVGKGVLIPVSALRTGFLYHPVPWLFAFRGFFTPHWFCASRRLYLHE